MTTRLRAEIHRLWTAGLERVLLNKWLMAVLLAAAVLSVQFFVGAFKSERGLYSDEASHLMNGLVLRDYAWSGFSQDPVTFARDYYLHYPKIAPFMWPPFFHAVLGIALLPGWPAMEASIVVVGLFAAWTVWRLYFIVTRFASIPAALGVVSLFLLTPGVVKLSSSIMLDIVVAALVLEATFWLGRFFESSSVRHATLYGTMTALASLAKGNGLSAVLMPLFLIALTRRWNVLRQPGLYIAAVIVVLFAAPLMYVTYRLDASLGDFGSVTLPMIWERAAFYGGVVLRELGLAPVILAVAGTLVAAKRPAWLPVGAGVQVMALVAAVGGGFLFHLMNPHILYHQRYITLVLAPVLGLSALGVVAICHRLQSPRARWAAQLSVSAAMLMVHSLTGAPLSAQAPLGYREVVSQFATLGDLAGQRALVISDEGGEGSFVTEVAVLGLKPRPFLIRGSKFLASDDWMGRSFALRFSSTLDILTALESAHITLVVVDSAPEARRLAHYDQWQTLVRDYPDRVESVFTNTPDLTRGPLRPLTVYRLRNKAPGAPASLDWLLNSPLVPPR